MKKYRAKFNPNSKGVYAVSLVDEPAMEGNFLQFEKQKEIKFAKVSESKRRVMGLILEPNKEILRFNKQDNSEYTVFLEAQDIEDVAYNFQKKGYQNNSTLQHNGKAIEGVSFVETWIVENPKIDKSANFGFEYPKGSWVGVMQLENESIWNEFVLSGKVKGFSIDAFLEFEEIKLNTINMKVENEVSILELLKELPSKIILAMTPKEKEEEEIKPEKMAEYSKDEEDDKDKKVKMEDEVVEAAPLDVEKVLADLVSKIQEMLAPMQEETLAMSKEIKALELKVSTQSEELIQLGKAPATPSIRRVNLEAKENSSSYEKFRNRNK
jgi:hypothetical protein